MSLRTVITSAALLGLGVFGQARGAESEAPPLPREGAFERLDQNHDGVIRREEFERARDQRAGQRPFERGDRGKRGARGARGIFRDGEALERRMDEAIDRALERAQGDPEKLRRALHDELSQAMRRDRGPQHPAESPLTAPDAERRGRRRGAPRGDEQPGARARGFGERRRRDGGPGDRDDARRQRRNPEERAERIMGRFDENDDGVLTADELEGKRSERLLRADADGDGRVDRRELVERLRRSRDDSGLGSRRDRGEPDTRPPPPPPGE